jgi:signal transduction histidine kinase/ActR/RegA family two-component response regulator
VLYIVLVLATIALWSQFVRDRDAALALALLSHRAERHTEAQSVALNLEASFRQMYQGLRTIARLPGVRRLDEEASALPEDARISAQEIYNNLAENVSVSELYIVPVRFDPDAIDAATGKPQKPALTFDELIVGKTADQKTADQRRGSSPSTEIEEIEIYEYREMRKQLGWLMAHHPTEATIPALAYPAIASPEVITCDNTRYSPQAPNDHDRSGIVYSVPYYNTNGQLAGIVTAVILSDVFSHMLPSGFQVLGNSELGLTIGSKTHDTWRRMFTGFVATAQAATVSYEEIIPLRFPEVSGNWRLWAASPSVEFKKRLDVIAIENTFILKMAVLLSSMLALALALRWQMGRQSQIVERNLKLEERIKERTVALAAAKRDAELANSAKSRFLANVSHEIRTPLHAIMTAADLLAAGPTEAPKSSKIGMIQSASRALVDLVNQVLDLSAIEQGRVNLSSERFAPSELLERTCTMLSASATAKGLSLEHEATSECSQLVAGDSQRIRQVLINLIGNAIKFTQSGSVHVSVERVQTAPGADSLVFQVRDTGAGISEAARANLFQPFHPGQTGIGLDCGAGLGLAISRQLVELMGGTIQLVESDAAGTCFRFTIPCEAAPSAAQQTAKAAAVKEHAAIEARVLLAEDNPVMQQLTRELLEQLGCEVVVAGNGQEAADLASTSRFDIILMDSRMPVLDGRESARLIRRREATLKQPPVPIVALTANAFDSDRRNCLSAGMTDFLSKPFTFAELVAALETNLPSADASTLSLN